MGNAALTRAFFICLPLLTKDEEITPKCIKLYYMGEKTKLPSLYAAKRRNTASSCTKMFVYWERSCVELVSQCGDFVWKRAAGIVLQRTSKPLDPPALPRNSGSLAYSLWLQSLKRVQRRAAGSEFPSHLLLQEEKRVWSSPLKTELDHERTHKTIAFLTAGIKNFKPAVFNQTSFRPN